MNEAQVRMVVVQVSQEDRRLSSHSLTHPRQRICWGPVTVFNFLSHCTGLLRYQENTVAVPWLHLPHILHPLVNHPDILFKLVLHYGRCSFNLEINTHGKGSGHMTNNGCCSVVRFCSLSNVFFFCLCYYYIMELTLYDKTFSFKSVYATRRSLVFGLFLAVCQLQCQFA